MSPELIKLLQETSTTRVKDLQLREISQKLYEEVYEFLTKKYGTAMGRTNIMLNGHLVTPNLEEAMKAHANILEAPK